jgi:hypothetical protein
MDWLLFVLYQNILFFQFGMWHVLSFRCYNSISMWLLTWIYWSSFLWLGLRYKNFFFNMFLDSQWLNEGSVFLFSEFSRKPWMKSGLKILPKFTLCIYLYLLYISEKSYNSSVMFNRTVFYFIDIQILLCSISFCFFILHFLTGFCVKNWTVLHIVHIYT